MATQEEQLQQRVALSKIVKVDLPVIDAGELQAIKDRHDLKKMPRIIILLAVRGRGMSEPAVRPGLARR